MTSNCPSLTEAEVQEFQATSIAKDNSRLWNLPPNLSENPNRAEERLEGLRELVESGNWLGAKLYNEAYKQVFAESRNTSIVLYLDYFVRTFKEAEVRAADCGWEALKNLDHPFNANRNTVDRNSK